MATTNKLEGCFGGTDLIFASHLSDENRAFEWLASLRNEGIGWKAAKIQIDNFLVHKGASKLHITKQVKKAKRLLEPWLLD